MLTQIITVISWTRAAAKLRTSLPWTLKFTGMRYLFCSLFTALLFCIALAGCNDSNEGILVGEQVWMSENLNVDKFRNGDPIPEAKTDLEWNLAAVNHLPAWCYYDNDPDNGERFGKIYNWYAISDSRGIAPEGWRVPTETDWLRLADYLGGDTIAGKKLKSIDYWTNKENGNPGNGVDEFDFCGLPGGCRGKDRSFSLLGETGAWWSLANYGQDKSGIFFVYKESNSCKVNSADKAAGLYLRCIKSTEGANTAFYEENIAPINETDDGVYKYSDNDAEFTIWVSGNSWMSKLKYFSGFGENYDDANAIYKSGILLGKDLYDASGVFKFGYIYKDIINTSDSGLHLRLLKQNTNAASHQNNLDDGILSANRSKTTITFSKKDHDFGIIKQGDKVECVFQITNTGNQPLILEEIHGSCGCVTAEFSKDPIPVGQSTEIKVKFNSHGKKGKQAKSLTITANTKPIQNLLTIYADVQI